MFRRFLHRPLRVLGFTCGAAWLGTAAALPAGPTASQRLTALRAETAHAAMLAEPLRRAQASLDRARTAEQARDTAHAARWRAAAEEWLGVATDLLRAAAAEQKAGGTEKTLDDLNTKVVREQALLEETVARRGRAQKALDELDQSGAAGASEQPPTLPAKPGPQATRPATPNAHEAKPGPSSAPAAAPK